jgi:hypothetical protein
VGDRHAAVDDARRKDGPRERTEARRPEHEARDKNLGRTRAAGDYSEMTGPETQQAAWEVLDRAHRS